MARNWRCCLRIGICAVITGTIDAQDKRHGHMVFKRENVAGSRVNDLETFSWRTLVRVVGATILCDPQIENQKHECHDARYDFLSHPLFAV